MTWDERDRWEILFFDICSVADSSLLGEFFSWSQSKTHCSIRDHLRAIVKKKLTVADSSCLSKSDIKNALSGGKQGCEEFQFGWISLEA